MGTHPARRAGVVAVVFVIGVVSFFFGRIGAVAPLALTVVGVGVGAIPARCSGGDQSR